jgi:hypothetical protein
MFGDDLTTGSTLRTFHRACRMRGQFSHVTGLDRPAELSSQFVGAGFDHRIVRDAHDRTVGPIQGHRNLSRLLKQLVQLFLKRRRRSIHESASAWGMTGFLNRQVDALYHRINQFLH